PEGRDPEGASSDLGVPDENTGRERLAPDLRPALRVDEEGEHVLLATVESRAAVEGLGRWPEVDRELADHRQEVDVPEPGVVRPVDRADAASLGQDLGGPALGGQGLRESPRRRL